MPDQQAVVLLSGGLDSTTVLALARAEGFACNCLSFQYGQRQRVELDRAREIAVRCGARRHLVLRVDLDAIGGSALTGSEPVPKDRHPSADPDDIPTHIIIRFSSSYGEAYVGDPSNKLWIDNVKLIEKR